MIIFIIFSCRQYNKIAEDTFSDQQPIEIEEYDSGEEDTSQEDTSEEDTSTEEPTDDDSCDPYAFDIGLPLGEQKNFSVSIGPGEPFLPVLTENNIFFYPDGAISILDTEDGVDVFLPVGHETMMLQGSDLNNLSIAESNPILSTSSTAQQPHQGYIGANSVLECQEKRVAFFHAEYHLLGLEQPQDTPPPYHASMGRVVAENDANTFVHDTPSWVLTSAGQAQYSLPKIAYGAGGGSILNLSNSYLYMYYYDWDSTQGVHLARACADTCGAPGSWKKWDGSSFSSDALGEDFLSPSGESIPIIPASSTQFDAFNVVSFNTYLNAFLMVSATESGLSMRTSIDGVHWGERKELLHHVFAHDVRMRFLYPSIFDSDSWSRNHTGRNLTLVYGLEMDNKGQLGAHRAWKANIQLTLENDAQTMHEDVQVIHRYIRPDPLDHWVDTEINSSEYTYESALGTIASNSLPDTVPLYSCIQNENHFVSTLSSCEGEESLRLIGYIWTQQNEQRVALHRCWVETNEGINHFVSLDAQCEGQQIEGIIGFVLP